MPTALVSRTRMAGIVDTAGRPHAGRATGSWSRTPRTLDAEVAAAARLRFVSRRHFRRQQIVTPGTRSIDEWRRAVSVLHDRPRVLAGLYGALVPLLLVITARIS